MLPPEVNVWRAVQWAWKSIDRATMQGRSSPIGVVARYVRGHRDQFSTTPLHRGLSVEEVQKLPGLLHEGEHGPEILLPKRAFDRAFEKIGGARAVMPALVGKGLAFAEDVEGKRWQVKRGLNRKTRIRLYAIKASILKMGE